MQRLVALCLSLLATCWSTASFAQAQWSDIARDNIAQLADDDLARHASDSTFLDGLTVSEAKFEEAGFNWHLLRFANKDKPLGPLWVVPHDDENAAFEAAIEAVKAHGGVAVMVNSGPGSSRMQSGQGTCGGRSATVSRCDPNRNFAAATPLFSGAFLDQLPAGQPVIALHTNSPGFGRGQGDITILDASAARQGVIRPRRDGHFGAAGAEILADHDSYAIIPYVRPSPSAADNACRQVLVDKGVHVWHERVEKSDGSLSNYIALNRPERRYVNMESRRETDLTLAAARHRLMIEAYVTGCIISGN